MSSTKINLKQALKFHKSSNEFDSPLVHDVTRQNSTVKIGKDRAETHYIEPELTHIYPTKSEFFKSESEFSGGKHRSNKRKSNKKKRRYSIRKRKLYTSYFH